MNKIILNEDIFDAFVVPDIEAEFVIENETPNPPEIGYDTGLSVEIIDAINDEWNTIAKYNQLLANLKDEDMVNVIKDIVAEENTHVGQLQKILETISPNVSNIEKGELEADQQIGETVVS